MLLQSIKNGQASVAVNAFTYNTRVAPVTSYVAQLIPLPDTFVERFGFFKCDYMSQQHATL